MKMRIILFLMMIAFIAFPTFGQEEYVDVRTGNKFYKSEQYTEAEIAYRKGLLKNPKSVEATYNLGNALFKQEKYAEALEQYQKVIPTADISKTKLASALHNTGNALLMQQQIAESIEAYKKSLRINPKDDETRYNLAYAQQLLKKQDNQDKNDKQDQKQDQQNQENQQNKQEKNEEEQEEQPQPSDISKDRAEQILEALMQDENDTMEKAKKQPRSSRKGADKDW